MPSVQFYGVDQVMEASRNRECPCWAIFINRALFCKYEDSTDTKASMDMLEKHLDSLEESGNNAAIYTLKFFECAKGHSIKVNEKTVCDGGQFNFKLVSPEQHEQGVMRIGSVYQNNKLMEERIKKLEEELKQTVVEPEPETVGSVIIDLLKKPQDLAFLINVAKGAIGLPMTNYSETMGSLSGIPKAAEQISNDEAVERMSNAMTTLENADPKLLTHLEKLAKMSQDKPDQFKSTLGILDLYNL